MQIETTFGNCKGCGEEKEVKVPEYLCGGCWSKKAYMRKKQMRQAQQFYKKKDQKYQKEQTAADEGNCKSCGKAVKLFALNPMGNCGSCQAEMNTKLHKEELEYEKSLKRK